eukprot:1176092-Prorocentrum_minimum.AAC.9
MAPVQNWRENWVNKVLTVNSTVSVKNWRENWLNKVLTVNSTVSVSSPNSSPGMTCVALETCSID